jgi:hypothetical protein
LLFCRSALAQWTCLTDVLRLYEEASGQCLNNNKTFIFFSENTSLVDKEALVAIFGIQSIQHCDTYLGLPALVGKSRMVAFQDIVDRV